MDNSFDLPKQAGWGVVLHGNVVAFASNAEKAIGMSPGAEAPLFTADQMQAHARAAVEVEREACAKLCDERAYFWEFIVEREQEARQIAELIRARGKS